MTMAATMSPTNMFSDEKKIDEILVSLESTEPDNEAQRLAEDALRAAEEAKQAVERLREVRKSFLYMNQEAKKPQQPAVVQVETVDEDSDDDTIEEKVVVETPDVVVGDVNTTATDAEIPTDANSAKPAPENGSVEENKDVNDEPQEVAAPEVEAAPETQPVEDSLSFDNAVQLNKPAEAEQKEVARVEVVLDDDLPAPGTTNIANEEPDLLSFNDPNDEPDSPGAIRAMFSSSFGPELDLLSLEDVPAPILGEGVTPAPAASVVEADLLSLGDEVAEPTTDVPVDDLLSVMMQAPTQAEPTESPPILPPPPPPTGVAQTDLSTPSVEPPVDVVTSPETPAVAVESGDKAPAQEHAAPEAGQPETTEGEVAEKPKVEAPSLNEEVEIAIQQDPLSVLMTAPITSIVLTPTNEPLTTLQEDELEDKPTEDSSMEQAEEVAGKQQDVKVVEPNDVAETTATPDATEKLAIKPATTDEDKFNELMGNIDSQIGSIKAQRTLLPNKSPKAEAETKLAEAPLGSESESGAVPDESVLPTTPTKRIPYKIELVASSEGSQAGHASPVPDKSVIPAVPVEVAPVVKEDISQTKSLDRDPPGTQMSQSKDMDGAAELNRNVTRDTAIEKEASDCAQLGGDCACIIQ